jgi:hypothetical protein
LSAFHAEEHEKFGAPSSLTVPAGCCGKATVVPAGVGSSEQPWQVTSFLVFQQHICRSPGIIGAAYAIHAAVDCDATIALNVASSEPLHRPRFEPRVLQTGLGRLCAGPDRDDQQQPRGFHLFNNSIM